ncbi:hypothetical protein [Amycolatopsis sp. FDAARGOS 1241]|uniref:hypothetical protein n=1 Tax=Amycolatopsis sp. FDAARGOS 1241 TaxID=2778070 RepID=UPI001EF221C0|nr:hypothetical protein [Amycolatopsis sp. FDAARGOS 1241]
MDAGSGTVLLALAGRLALERPRPAGQQAPQVVHDGAGIELAGKEPEVAVGADQGDAAVVERAAGEEGIGVEDAIARHRRVRTTGPSPARTGSSRWPVSTTGPGRSISSASELGALPAVRRPGLACRSRSRGCPWRRPWTKGLSR